MTSEQIAARIMKTIHRNAPHPTAVFVMEGTLRAYRVGSENHQAAPEQSLLGVYDPSVAMRDLSADLDFADEVMG